MGIASIAQVASSLKVAGDIAKAMVNLRDAEAFRNKAIDFQSAVMAAQGHAIEAQAAQSTLIDRVRDLEKEMANLKAWDREKARYELIDLYRGIFAFVLKDDAQSSEPAHALCAHCYNKGLKSYLQTNGVQNAHLRTLNCKSCGFSAHNQWSDMSALIKHSREHHARLTGAIA